MKDFLKHTGWADAAQKPVTPDWSPRQFWRLTKADKATAILMCAPKDIPGHGLREFIYLSDHLRAAGYSTPKIYAVDLKDKCLLIEDFGDIAIDTPAIEKTAYETAVDLLAEFRGDAIPLTPYKDGYIYKKLALFSDDPSWMHTWEEIEKSLPPAPLVFSHMDYKAGNLHWLPARKSVQRVGLLDFQAAQRAPFTYDLVNLLEDARRDLKPGLKIELKLRFKDKLPDDWKPMFDDWYTFMAAQFHARVLGQIRGNTKVASDVQPRLETYLREELKNPLLEPLRPHIEKHLS